MSLEAREFMPENTVDRPPSFVPELATPSDRFTGLPPRPELTIEKSKEFIIEDELLGGVFSPSFSSDPRSADILIRKVHLFDQEKDVIKPFLRWMIAGRVNNPYLVLSSSDRPTGREADCLGTEEVRDPTTGMEDPRRAVKIKAQEGASFIRGVRATPGGDDRVERMLQILRQGKISGPSQHLQRNEDIRLLHELDAALGLSRMMFRGSRSEGDEKNYRWIENASETGKKAREGTASIVDKLVEQEAKDPEKPLLDYEVLDEGEGVDRRVRIIRRVRFPLNLKKPRSGFERSRIDLSLAKEGLNAEEKDGYEILALAAHYLSDPIIRMAIESTYKQDIPRVKADDAKGYVRIVIERLKKAFLMDIE